MEEEEKGITIGELFKIIFKRVWWVVGVTAAVLIAFVCIIQFWYNPNHRVYSAQFELRMPGGNTYPNGTELRLADSVLLENLQIIKDESLYPESQRTGKFANVDIVGMVEKDDIRFKQTIEKLEDETYAYSNTIEVCEKYFKNSKQASDFVKAVVEFPINNAIKIVNEMTYTSYIYNYNIAVTYEDKIDNLIAQKNYIEKLYSSLAEKYSSDYVPEGLQNAKPIRDYLLDLSLKFDTREQQALYNIKSANYYVLDSETYISNAQMQIESLQIEIEETENVLSSIIKERDEFATKYPNVQTSEAFNKRITELVETNANRENEITRIRKTLVEIEKYNEGDAKAAKEQFNARMDGIRDMLVEETAKAKEVYVAAYNEKARVEYVNNVVKAEGGINIVIAAVIGLVLGFAAVSAVILIIDLPKYKREKLTAQAGGGAEQLEIDAETKE